jgi:hypothetical protein
MTNFARSSLVLMLRAFFGGLKSCALVNIFMICRPLVASRPRPNSAPGSGPSHGYQTQGRVQKIQPAVMAKAPPLQEAGLRAHRDIPRERSSVFRSRAIRDAGISVPQKRKGPMRKGLLRMLDLGVR